MEWIKFIRQYGPIARNDNMYDETIQRSAKRNGIRPITFEHPQLDDVLGCFKDSQSLTSVILTGTAGDGKTHLCRQVWMELGGGQDQWNSDKPHISLLLANSGGDAVIHFIRDLSAWVPQRDSVWEPEKALLLQQFSKSLFTNEVNEVFLIAANDGQLIETWRRLPPDQNVEKARSVIETLLVEDKQYLEDVKLNFFNLSRGSSAELLELILTAFVGHEGWAECYGDGNQRDTDFFGPRCPIRQNFEILKTPLFQKRLKALFELCDYSQLHIPIRQILLLLSNAILGHPTANKDRLMLPGDVPSIIRENTLSKASIFNNIFGGNLSESRRENIAIFDYLNRFRIGYETSNRIDNILIYGEADENFTEYFELLMGPQQYYGADEVFRTAQKEYLESSEEDETRSSSFLEQLVNQRRGLYFKIPEKLEEELGFWELTVFKFAGEYLSKVIGTLKAGARVERNILARLVKGLNRIFIGMLVSGDRELFLATSLSTSDARVSRILADRISVTPRLGEKIEILLPAESNVPVFRVTLSDQISRSFELHLTRYEFLSRVAEGALPSSFSKECNEDMLAFKSQLLSALSERQQGEIDGEALSFKLLTLDDNGYPTEEVLEVSNV